VQDNSTIASLAAELSLSLKTVREARFDSSASFLVKGMLAARGVSVWCGDRLSSLLALHIGYAVAQGEPRTVFGRRVDAAGVLYAGFGDEIELERRIRALCLRFGEAHGLRYLSAALRYFTSDAGASQIVRAMQDSGARLLIVDNVDWLLSKDVTGEELFRRVQAIEGCATAHVALTTSGSAEKVTALLEQSNVDTSARIFTVEPTRNGYRVTTDSPASLIRGQAAFRLDEVELGYDAEGDVVTSFVIREGETIPSQFQRIKITARQARLLEAVESAIHMSGESIFLADGVSRPSISKVALRRHLLTQGLLVGDSSDGGRRISRNQHNKIWKQLNALESKGFIGHDREQVWLFPSIYDRIARQEATLPV
jgi:hypothetical protein